MALDNCEGEIAGRVLNSALGGWGRGEKEREEEERTQPTRVGCTMEAQ